MNWMSIVGLCLIVLGTVFSFFGTYTANKNSQDDLSLKIQEKNEVIENINKNNIKLIDQNSSLLTSNTEVSTTNKDLIVQNQEMLNKIANYQSDLEARNLRIRELKEEVSNIKEYSYYADYTIYGTNFNAGNGISISSDLSNRMKKIIVKKDRKDYVNNIKENIPLIDEIIEKYPSFPFGYFAKYNILKAFGNPEWKIYAQKAIKIFKITTSIQGHHPSHEQALRLLEISLKND